MEETCPASQKKDDAPQSSGTYPRMKGWFNIKKKQSGNAIHYINRKKAQDCLNRRRESTAQNPILLSEHTQQNQEYKGLP